MFEQQTGKRCKVGTTRFTVSSTVVLLLTLILAVLPKADTTRTDLDVEVELDMFFDSRPGQVESGFRKTHFETQKASL